MYSYDMKKSSKAKMDSLAKYVPFIDFVLKIDPLKYVKFSNIRKWILLKKKKYSLSDLNKIEQSIITQYKNLLLEKKVQIPQHISNIFAPVVLKQFVDLCSDDEDEVNKNTSKQCEERSTQSNTNQKCFNKGIGADDDDLEFISVDYVHQTEQKILKGALDKSSMNKASTDEGNVGDAALQDIFNPINKLIEKEKNVSIGDNEPHIYTYNKKSCSVDTTKDDEVIYNTRKLFKRRADFEDEVIVENLSNNHKIQFNINRPCDVISLDSDSDNEVCPSTSNQVISKEIGSKENVETTLRETDKIVENIEFNSSGSNTINKRIELLCNSIELALPDMCDLMIESPNVCNNSATILPNEHNNDNPPCVNIKDNTSNTPTLSPEEMAKLLEDISDTNDFDKELPSKTSATSNSPTVKFPTLPIQCSANNRPRLPAQKINLNDPRIRKQLQIIKNSPLFTCNILPVEVENNIRKICQYQSITQQQRQPHQQITLQSSEKQIVICCPKTSKSPISYGKYKQRQLEKRLQMETQRTQENEAKEKTETVIQRHREEGFKVKENAEMEKQGAKEYKEKEELDLRRQEAEQLKSKENLKILKQATEQPKTKTTSQMEQDNDIRAKLLSTLDPCREQLEALWNLQQASMPSSNTNNNGNMEIEQHIEKNIESMLAGQEGNDMEEAYCGTHVKKNNKKSKKKNNNNISDQKLCRIYNELKCTVKGFDKIHDSLGETSTEKIKLNNTNPAHTTEARLMPTPIAQRRKSTIHAPSPISERLSDSSPDILDSEFISPINSQRHLKNVPLNSSTKIIPPDSPCLALKIRKKNFEQNSADNGDGSLKKLSSVNENKTKISKGKLTKTPIVVLHRMSNNFIRKHIKRLEENKHAETPMRKPIVLKKSSEKVKNSKEPALKMAKLKKYNNDCQMTERNTLFCVLCRSKPSDLTNHYIGRHKTESYVSRLDWTELEELAINPPFAKLQPRQKNSRIDRYEVLCPLCKENICDSFINLYNHYAAHTGEYAFQCSNCRLSKPYKPDIQSHLLHSKTCRHSSIQIMYRYPPETQCIYIHYCTICNFVQLNEANVLKHLREHHDYSMSNSANVQKCILAAMSDGPDVNQTCKSPLPALSPILKAVEQKVNDNEGAVHSSGGVTELEANVSNEKIYFKVDDDDVQVSNEPCLDDENLNEEKYSLEEKWQQNHDVHPSTNIVQPMTIVHSGENVFYPERRHLPIMIKAETTNIAENISTFSTNSNHLIRESHITPPRKNDSMYEKYRCYPANVSYLGLYKCMIDDCYYSTDQGVELVKHLNEHSTCDLRSSEYIQCPYCVITEDIANTPEQLVEHIRTQHAHLYFQCSECCYRSSTAFNVHIHQKLQHGKPCNIYKCSVDFSKTNESRDLKRQIVECITNILCKICNIGFYYTHIFVKHMEKVHNLHDINGLTIYSCIYCKNMTHSKNEIVNHVATMHPGEQPLIYDHNMQMSSCNEDTPSTSNVIDITESVKWTDVTLPARTDSREGMVLDVKPSCKELLQMNEEIVKVRLQKLTAHTGESPDCLYRCPEEECGGFFSNVELWLRHMKVRHVSFECKCPHCPSATLLPLEQFSLHFGEHRRHTFICFYCSTTCATEISARNHATEKHTEFNEMRFEKIYFNISYSYFIMIQKDLFNERETFIAELMHILQKRFEELENNEKKKLRTQWPVLRNTSWVDDYLKMFATRKIVLRCLVKDCDFRATRDDDLYNHLNTSHTITGTQFKCSKCDYQVEKCKNLDELFKHIKLHNEYIFICSACSAITPSRAKIFTHIEKQHSARDVPVVHLFRTGDQMYFKVYIIFADNYLSFSTMKNCFCCSERNMESDVFSLHLKHYHKLSLNYGCLKCSNFSFNSLKEVRPHFEQFHNSTIVKISCELAGHNDLNVISLIDFEIRISKTNCLSHIKSEPTEDTNDVILIEDNDIEIINSLRQNQSSHCEMPQLKCASLSKLIDPSIKTSSMHSPLLQSHFPQTNASLQQLNFTSSISSPSVVHPISYHQYNLGPTATNSPVYILNSLNSINTSGVANRPQMTYSNTIVTPNMLRNNMRTEVPLLPPSAIQPQFSINGYHIRAPNSLCLNQTSHIQNPAHLSYSTPYFIPPKT